MKPFPLFKNLMLCIASAALASIVFYFISQSYLISQAEKNIQNLLLSHKGIHHYVQNIMLPALYDYKKRGKIPEKFYAPELFSSSFIVRNQHKYYNQELADSGFPDLYYKLAANNPRNPINKADELEKSLILRFNENRELKKYREIIEIDGKEYLYFAIPFLQNDKRCMVCHGKREDAPLELQEKYPGQGGFNEKIGEIRAITSIRAPLQQEYHLLYIIVPSLAVGSFALGLLLFFNMQLRGKVRESTESLKEEIREKQEVYFKLHESEKYLKSIQDSMQVGLLLIDAKTYEIADVNKAALNLIGTSRENILGKKCFSFICPMLQGCCPINDEKKTIDKSEKILVDSTGREIPILKTATRILFNEKDYILETFIDITEQKETEVSRVKLENRLNQAQKMEAIGTLAGGIAHDFNNILTPILGYTEIVQSTLPERSESRENLSEVLKAAYRAKELVKQILTFSRQTEHELKPLKISLVIKEALKLLRSTIPTTIEIKENIDAQTGNVLADPTQIHQVLMNLCTNAYQAMRETGGILAVELKNIEIGKGDEKVAGLHLAVGPYVKLCVSDSGPGMERAVADKIFEPYFTTKKKGEGTGLGLSLVHGIVKSHGGHITVYSEPGKGTSFHVYLPRAIIEADAPETRNNSPLPTGNERILLVDDEEQIAGLEHQILSSLGYQVTSMTSSKQALATFTANPGNFDLVITDMTMPDMNGAELCQNLLAIRPDLPIILCTGFSELINKEKAESIGVREYIMKPVLRKDLAIVIRKILDHS
ncbi:MAG: DUF3365 domain-containing protein [Proteobacteria bacterium]|nr:DUF3365 domain-containing protein [Pseudomonadota bacterium]MBU1715088.1 DUF3365 domain-containing protein [Pseudomonadota bacterium]